MYAPDSNEGKLKVDEASKQIVAQAIVVSTGFQEAMLSFAKARMAFYCAGVVFGLGMAQAALAPFIEKKE